MALDLGEITDAHIHQWDPYTTPREASPAARLYRRFPRTFEAAFPLLVPTANRQFINTPEYIGRPFLPPQFRRAATADDTNLTYEVTNVVHVEASWKATGTDSADETRWVAGLPFDPPTLLAIVAHADPRWPALPATLDAHHTASAKVTGIRCSAARHPDRRIKQWTDRDHLYRDPEFLTGFAEIANRNLTFDAWVYSHQIPDVTALAAAYPNTPIVLDHCGTPVAIAGPRGATAGTTPADRATITHTWLDHLRELSEQPNVTIKLSGFGMPIAGWARPASPTEFIDFWQPHVTAIIKMFGPQRVMFASNSPMDLPTVNYPTLVKLVANATIDAASADALHAVFTSNAHRIYRNDNTQ